MTGGNYSRIVLLKKGGYRLSIGEGSRFRRYVLLSSATKNHEGIMRFYAAQGFDIWSIVFFKQLE
jgi:hypothetical protein